MHNHYGLFRLDERISDPVAGDETMLDVARKEIHFDREQAFARDLSSLGIGG